MKKPLILSGVMILFNIVRVYLGVRAGNMTNVLHGTFFSGVFTSLFTISLACLISDWYDSKNSDLQ